MTKPKAAPAAKAAPKAKTAKPGKGVTATVHDPAVFRHFAPAAGKTQMEELALMAIDPEVRAAQTMRAAANFNKSDMGITELFHALVYAGKQSNGGDLAKMESILTSQAIVLDTLFHRLAQRGLDNMGTHLSATETYMRMAMKAQAQSRATIEALVLAKNPNPYIRQANIGTNVQVNNGAVRAGAPARGNSGLANELLENCDGERVDTGTAAAAIGNDSRLAAVGSIDRRKDGSR